MVPGYMRVTVDDILHHIAQDLRCYSGADPLAAVEEFFSGCIFDMRLSITTDVEDTELNYLVRFGKGQTYYFKLKDYEHGKTLAEHLYYAITGRKPDMGKYTGDKFNSGEMLYLFVHIRNIVPKPVKLKVTREHTEADLN
jgi:hypothetical protein